MDEVANEVTRPANTLPVDESQRFRNLNPSTERDPFSLPLAQLFVSQTWRGRHSLVIVVLNNQPEKQRLDEHSLNMSAQPQIVVAAEAIASAAQYAPSKLKLMAAFLASS